MIILEPELEILARQPREFLLGALNRFLTTETSALVKVRVIMYISIINLQPHNDFKDWTTWQLINLLDESMYNGLEGRINHKAPTRLLCEGLNRSEEEQEKLISQIFEH
eukprot:TRINITY_DN70643_c0_g1_i1.p1 TRINITY_DN70643_c0_g1~~TRINITY_DN70643_c0_g1_i1.p1  ORF type:complete len:109 (+),score=25.28 TRINITY_DN70643_c0_g1_i1:94-420(+)